MKATTSSLSWLAYDSAEKERMQRVLALFRERDTRDELGLGGIRDSFAEQLFPGTSTIQTRLRYFLFVPWMYRELERERVASARAERAGRDFELRIMDALKESPDVAGVFGVSAGRTIKRLPSEVYWSGLGSWGLRRFEGSQQDYWRALDAIYARRSRARLHDEATVDPGLLSDTWHPDLPPAPPGFPDSVELRLEREEAVFLQDCIVKRHGASFLAWLTERAGKPTPNVDFPWLHPDLAHAHPDQRTLLHHAALFSRVMNGASRLYNVALAEHAGRKDTANEHRRALVAWAGAIDPAELAGWSLDELWGCVIGKGPIVTPAACRFVTAWVKEVAQGAQGLADRDSARALVRAREGQLKGPRSRFVNRRALDQWGGKSGVRPLDYRWATVRVLLDDLHDALKRKH
jgi:hypothetical protein